MTTEQAILGAVPNPHAKAVINIKMTNGWIVKHQNNFFDDYQLTHQQYNILRIVKGQHPEGVSIIDIKRRMVDKMSNVGRLVEKLQQKGYVERVEGSDDRRVIFVHLTDVGLQVLATIADNFHLMLSHFENITVEEAGELVRILEKMRGKPNAKTRKKTDEAAF
jgi:DNA-binding MarR family transcriptional regulator